ncbi:MAG: DUF2971 domain-containing protein [Paludibacteraceae bacterium]|nr:DUF2971 domain-containing protein [Paludibacteraceae bacterium]
MEKNRKEWQFGEPFLAKTESLMDFVYDPWFNVQETPVLYHYSSVKALFSEILIRKPENDDKAISLFATDSRYLNDVSEIELGKRMMREVFEKMKISSYNRIVEEVGELERMNIISFSKEHDSIPMWSTYGNNGDGIALGFDSGVLKEHLRFICPCLYSQEATEESLRRLMDYYLGKNHSQEEMREIILQIMVVCTIILGQIKNSYYEYEKEVRYITLPLHKPEFRLKNNLIIPYARVFLPRRALRRVIIGPNLDRQLTFLSIRDYIRSIGYKDVEIIQSDAPFRNL